MLAQALPKTKMRVANIFCMSVCSLLGLLGCSQLPKIAPPDAESHVQTIVLEDTKGPIRASRSKALIAGLTATEAQASALERHLAIEQTNTLMPLNVGNRVQLLQDGLATYQAMLKAIEAARDHINVETYIFDNDEIGKGFAAVLMEKQRQGVQVNIIRDSVGTHATPVDFFQKLMDSGINVLEFNPVNPLLAGIKWSPNQRDHRKLLIVDGSQAFLGGINISSVHSGGSFGQRSRRLASSAAAWRDTDLKLEGPVVAQLQKLFIATWEKQQGAPLPPKNYFPPLMAVGSTLVRAIGSAPDELTSQMYTTLLSAIGHARDSVYLTNAYFAPDPQLLAALEAAKRRGVDVRLLLPSRTDSWLVFHAGRAYYSKLLKAGVRIFQLRTAILHSKTALIDGVWASVGSTNLDWRSFLHNQELDAIVLGKEFGNQLQAMFDKDLADADEITLDQWQRRALDLRLKEAFARLWEYWL